MASLYVRLVDVRTLGPNEKQDLKDIADVGAYSKLAIQPRVIKAGTGGNLLIKHSATQDPESFATLATIALNAVSNTPLYFSDFLRNLRWETDGAVAGSPLALVDLVAKQG